MAEQAQTQDDSGPPAFTPTSPAAPEHDSELPSYDAHTREQRADPPPSAPALSAPGGGQQARAAAPSAATALRTESNRSLETTKGKKWLQLFVKSRASSSGMLPVFFEGDTVAGRVELDLDKAEGCKGVTIRVSV